MNQRVPITVAYGDGIGPEIMSAVLPVLEGAGAQLDLQTIEIGRKVYERGVTSGIAPEAWESLRRTRVFLKGPITTPLGGGYKSLNVTARVALGLYANVRPCVSYYPFVNTKHPRMDVVIVRENEEDTYAGIEHQQTPEVVQCLKLVSRSGCARIIRYAFDYARRNNRRKVTCFTKDNIMKMTDGLFHKTFDAVAAEYPDLRAEHLIIDIGAARLANAPEQFDVIVTLNLYGDIISDIAAEVAGSVGLAGSANIGDQCAMFEAIHGSAPTIAGRNVANPSGLLLAAVMMLVHVGQAEAAQRVHNAWLRTIEDGLHTADIHTIGMSQGGPLGTHQFAQAVIERLGQKPGVLKPVSYAATPGRGNGGEPPAPAPRPAAAPTVAPGAARLVGVDVFVHWDAQPRSPQALGARVEALGDARLKLRMITNRGVVVYPRGFPESYCTDHWRCRFTPAEGTLAAADIIRLLERLDAAGLQVVQTVNLYDFDGQRGYSLGQGE